MPTPTSAAARLEAYLDRLGAAVGHADRAGPLRAYVTGLLLPGARKSVEPMAAVVDPRHASARHQSMHHFVARAPWEAEDVLAVGRDLALAALERHAPVAAWIIDDTSFPKKGDHSVGVARQYSGIRGKTDNCQVAVTLSLANATMSVPCAVRLYLPRPWAEDLPRRRAADVPDDVVFLEKWRIALAQVEHLLAQGMPRAPILADAGYGDATEFREAITALGLSYAVGVQGQITVWPPGKAPLPPKRRAGRGRPPKRLRRTARHRPVSVETFARSLAPTQWHTVTWREGTKGAMRSRFARARVRAAHRDEQRTEPRPEEWLVMEWPEGAAAPTKFWLSSVPADVELEDLVALIKLRWRIERDYEEMKDELGLDHYEGRNWLGFHHHAVLCVAAYAFLAAERARLSPPQALAFLQAPRVPRGFRPRGSPAAP
jgi:SRSO17 transposase